jgi:seryl-tRNA synthetase
MAVLLAVLSWKRRRKDQELYESVLQTYHTRKELLNRAETLNVDVYQKNTELEQWTSIQFPPQKESGPGDPKRGNKNQSPKNERNAQQMQPSSATVDNQCPEVAVSIPPLRQDMLETTIGTERILPLPTASDPPGSAMQSGTKTPSENSSPQDKPKLPDAEAEDFPIPNNRKIKVDSIIVYCEKKKKLSRES